MITQPAALPPPAPPTRRPGCRQPREWSWGRQHPGFAVVWHVAGQGCPPTPHKQRWRRCGIAQRLGAREGLIVGWQQWVLMQRYFNEPMAAPRGHVVRRFAILRMAYTTAPAPWRPWPMKDQCSMGALHSAVPTCVTVADCLLGFLHAGAGDRPTPKRRDLWWAQHRMANGGGLARPDGASGPPTTVPGRWSGRWSGCPAWAVTASGAR